MATKTKTKPKTVRHYNKITPATLAQFKALRATVGNGTAAVRKQNPEIIQASHRAWKLSRKSKEVSAVDFIDEQLQQIGVDSIQRLGMIVNSTDERIAQKSVHFVIEQIRGKATQKSISLTGKIKAQDVLD